MVAALVVALLVASQLPLGLTFPSTAPAFLWSPYQDGYGSCRWSFDSSLSNGSQWLISSPAYL